MRHFLLTLALAGTTLSSSAALIAHDAATVTGLFTGATFSSLAYEDTHLYYPQNADIVEMAWHNGATQHIKTLPIDTVDVAALTRHATTTHLAHATQFGFVVPYLYSEFSGNTYTSFFTLDNIYDACVAPDGSRYIVANPGGAGSILYHYTNGALEEKATVGGPAGGIACGPDGTVYYAWQAPDFSHGTLIAFSADQLATGGLTYADARLITDIKASYVWLGPDSYLYATTPQNSALVRIDPHTGARLNTFAYDPDNDWQLGKVVGDAHTNLFVNYTDWSLFAGSLYHVALPLFPGFIGANDIAISHIYAPPGGTLGGLAIDHTGAYTGSGTDILRISLTNGVEENVCTLSNAVAIGAVARSASRTFIGYDISFAFPAPSVLAVCDGTGNPQDLIEIDSIFDIAVNSRDDVFIVANPGGSGSHIYRYDEDSTSLFHVATVGGASGGIAFGPEDELYYAWQAPDFINGEIWRFTDAQVQTGNLTGADAHLVAPVKAMYIACDVHGTLYVTRSHRSMIEAFDPATGESLGVVAYDPDNDWQAGALAYSMDDFTLYALYTDWSAFLSSIYAIHLPQECTVSHTVVDFGTVMIDEEVSQEITVHNSGNGILHGTLSTQPDAPFSVTGPDTFEISPIEAVIYTVSCEPQEIGAYTNAFVLMHDGGETTISLIADAVPEPAAAIIMGVMLLGFLRRRSQR